MEGKQEKHSAVDTFFSLGKAVFHFVIVGTFILGCLSVYQRAELLVKGSEVVTVTFDRDSLQEMVSQGWLVPREFDVNDKPQSKGRAAK